MSSPSAMSSTTTPARLLSKVQEEHDAYVVAAKKHGDQLIKFKSELDATQMNLETTTGEKIDEISCRIKESVLRQKQEDEKGRELVSTRKQKFDKIKAILDEVEKIIDLL
jgi:DNA-binding transcriptional regulator GbsR (MarR family)